MVTRPNPADFLDQTARTACFLLKMYPDAQCEFCGATHLEERQFGDIIARLPLTRDHIVPTSKGGANVIGNLRFLCRVCHNQNHFMPTFANVKTWRAK